MNAAPDQPELCHSLMEGSPVAMAELEGSGHVVRYANPAFCRLLGKSRQALVGSPFAAIAQEGDGSLAALDRVYRTGTAEIHAHPEHGEPHPAYWSYTLWPVLDADQQPIGVMMQVTETTQFHREASAMNEALLVSSVRQHELTESAETLNRQLQVEITDRKAANHALRASEAKYRTLFEAIDEGFCIIEKIETGPGEPSDFRYIAANPAFATQSGVSDVVGKSIREAFPLEPEEWFVIYDTILITGKAVRFERPLGAEGRIFEWYAVRIEDESDLRIAVIFGDITDRKRHEAHQRMLVNELNHRVKNTLATVQSIAIQSFRDGLDANLARRQFQGRLMALAKAHDVLTQESWEGAHLAQVVEQAVSPYRGEDGGRFETAGPDIWLTPKYALALAMALHELCTNAVKYGALSNDAGRVSIVWNVHDTEAGRALRIQWAEIGGPPVAPPTRRGFGSRLVQRGLKQDLGGTVQIDFAATGVVCTIEAPLRGEHTDRPISRVANEIGDHGL